MNTYTKYCPNVFVAKCDAEQEKGDTITLTTKYGQEHECEVHNHLGQTKDGCHLYSITRTDGFNSQERAKQKAERIRGHAVNAEKRSNEAYETRATKHERDFMSLGEPIKVGHHSEKRHRKLFEKYDNKMRKSIEEGDKAKAYLSRAEYWESKSKDINLSMPESLEYYEFRLHEAKRQHQLYKDKPELRRHSYSLTYANKAVKEGMKNVELAIKLWGEQSDIDQIFLEKKEAAEKKQPKKKKDLVKKYGGFFSFNTKQFKDGYSRIKSEGFVDEGEKVRHIRHGLYIPSKNVDNFINEL